jgi:hypothetical protein
MAIVPIRSMPGVQRDGTDFDKRAYADALWCRWQRGLPRKIGGYRAVTQQLAEIVYGMHSFSVNALQYVHLGSANELVQRRIDNSGIQVGFNDRTPAIAPSVDNIWQFDAIFDVNVADTVLLAHVAPNMDIASDDAQPFWYGQLTANTLLTAIGATRDPLSGGGFVVGGYYVTFGSGGQIQWNQTANNVTDTVDEDFITQQKIVRGLPVRGGGVPAGLLWSLDSLIIMALNAGGTPLWDFDTVGEISILSSRGVIEYDGVYYWPGVDRWMSYNGVIREVPNTFNSNYFFDNLNFEQRQKVFALKVPRFGEIWWFFPKGVGQVECNHAVIYNVRENCWYDTAIPNLGRSDGVYAKVYNKPFMTGVEASGTGYTLWQHETGVNQVAATTEPIPSYFETAELSMISAEQDPRDQSLSIQVIEPDFVQAGDLTLTVKGRANARAKQITHDPITITEQAALAVGVDAENQIARTKFAHRLMSFKFESNEPDGNFEMGHLVGHVEPADGRKTQ